MWSLASPLARRISGPRKFCSSPKNYFFNAIGTFPTWRSCLKMSVDRGEAEIICSFRVFRILTQLRHSQPVIQTEQHGLSHCVGLENANWGRGRHNSRKLELSVRQEHCKFAASALPTSRRHHQHLEVEQKCFGCLPGLSD